MYAGGGPGAARARLLRRPGAATGPDAALAAYPALL